MRDWSRDVTLESSPARCNRDEGTLFEVLFGIGGKEAHGIDTIPEGIVDLSVAK